MPDFDEKAGMDLIKDSMGLTDADLAPESEQLDWGDSGQDDGGSDGSDDSENLGEGSDEHSFESHNREFEQQSNLQSDRQQPQQRQQRAPDPLRQQNTLKFDPRATFRQDKQGNLVDSRTGEIIARKGSEARIYQRIHKEATDYIRAASGNINNTINAERQKVERAVQIGLGFEKQLSELKGTMQQLNAYQLPKEQLLEAAGLFKQAQTDPVGVLKNLLTRAALSGIDITQLGMDNKAFDPKTFVEMMRKEIQQGIEPVKQYTTERQKERESQQVESQYLQQAERQVSQFFGNVKEAVPYTHIFHAVLSQPRFQNMSLGEIWDKIQLHLMRNGIDPRQAPSRAQRQRLNGTQDGQRAPSRRMPNGQGMAPSGGNGGRQSNAGPAHPSMSYDAIIREVLGASAR